MKRNSSSATATAREDGAAAKRGRPSNAHNENNSSSDGAAGSVDVQVFLERDCDAASKTLIEQAKKRAAEMRSEFEKGKKALLAGLEAEKENLRNEDPHDATMGYTVTVKCVHGPYQGSEYTMAIDAKHHSSCYIGRSTGRKFRPPHGISLPKDAELSTTHAQIKMEKDGRLLFTDLDSTNGSSVNGLDVEPHEPLGLDADKPVKLAVGSSQLQLTFRAHP